MKKLLVIALALALWLPGALSGEAAARTSLTVSAAASLTDAARELGTLYQAANPDIAVLFNFGSSGALQTQIEEGAPADVFLSAAQRQMDALETKGFLQPGSRKNLLLNAVVLIVPANSALGLTGFADLAGAGVKSVALGEPAAVPVGQYAEEIFKSLSILPEVKAKANYGSDVRQVLAWVASGDVDCGVVYATDAATSGAVKIVAAAPAGSHRPVVYPAAVLKNSANNAAAQDFLDFLSGPKARAVFEKYGFTVL